MELKKLFGADPAIAYLVIATLAVLLFIFASFDICNLDRNNTPVSIQNWELFWFIIVSVIVVMELIFWTTTRRDNKGESRFTCTAIHKLQSFSGSVVLVGGLYSIISGCRRLVFLIANNLSVVDTVIFWIGIVVVSILCIVSFIHLNSLRFIYQNKK